MKCIILAGGFSTRLYPLTKYFPKGLLPIGNKELMRYILDDVTLVSSIDEIVVVTNHCYYPLFNVWLKAKYPKNRIRLLDDGAETAETRLGALGDLIYALNQLKWSENLFVAACDTLTGLKIKELLSFFELHRGVVNAFVDMHDPELIKHKLGCGVVRDSRLVNFVEKPVVPPSTLASIPYYIYPRETLDLIRQYVQQNGFADAPGEIMPWLIKQTPVYGHVVTDSYYYDIGTIEAYNRFAQNGCKIPT